MTGDEGYSGAPFPQIRGPDFMGPGPDTEDESGADSAFRSDGFDAPRPPQASSSVSCRASCRRERNGSDAPAGRGWRGGGRLGRGSGWSGGRGGARDRDPSDHRSRGRRRGGPGHPNDVVEHADGPAEGKRPHGGRLGAGPRRASRRGGLSFDGRGVGAASSAALNSVMGLGLGFANGMVEAATGFAHVINKPAAAQSFQARAAP